MKINKRNPLHILALAAFGINVLIALLLRPLLPHRNDKKTVILYGHKLSGNLLAIQEHWRTHAQDKMNMVYLTMDKAYRYQLQANGAESVLASNPVSCISLLLRADAVVSSHGLHVMAWMVGRSRIKFFDVWHGIPFKGFDADDFKLQHRFDETWVTSPLLADLYVQHFGFHPDKVKVTGYARTDQLIHPKHDKATTRKYLQLQPTGKIILFAPTWQQDADQRSIYPFGVPEDTFLDTLDTLAQRHNATIILRTHLNSHESNAASRPRILYRPFANFPDTEALLIACDILVCDWSSIAFDWLLLNRPTIFLDVPAPFAKGFSLGPEYRFDRLAHSLDDMLCQLEQVLQQTEQYNSSKQKKFVYGAVYGTFADGQASKRCFQRLQAQLLNDEFSQSPSLLK